MLKMLSPPSYTLYPFIPFPQNSKDIKQIVPHRDQIPSIFLLFRLNWINNNAILMLVMNGRKALYKVVCIHVSFNRACVVI